MRRYHLSDEEEAQVRKAFRKPGEAPEILIVTEKLLTGYDAPILYCMYLDKPMRDHVLLQAIARVNRPYQDEAGRRKTNGLIVDFVGVFDNLERALAFDSADVEGVVEGLDVLKEHFAALMERGRAEFLPLGKAKVRTRPPKPSWSTSATKSAAKPFTPFSANWRKCTKSSRRMRFCAPILRSTRRWWQCTVSCAVPTSPCAGG